MRFCEKLKLAMQQLELNQVQVVGLTGKSKGSVSMYLNGKTIPSEKTQSEIAVSLGLTPDYFEDEDTQTVITPRNAEEGIRRMTPEEAAAFLSLDKRTVRQGLQQGVFPWGYAIVTSVNPETGKKRWTYFINAKRFAEIEGIVVKNNVL